MTKDDILNYAMPSPSERSTLDALAAQHSTAEDIEAKAAEEINKAKRAEIWVSRCFKALAIPAGLLVVCLMGVQAERSLLAVGSLCAAAAITPVITNLIRHFDWKGQFHHGILAALQPIAGTEACQQALQYLEADAPGVATWRDIAISERGQLYHFDVGVMRRLHLLEEHRLQVEARLRDDARLANAAERQRLNDEACRKVHGLVPLAQI